MKDRKYCLQHCDYEAKESRSLEHHLRAKHEGIAFYCHICEYKAENEGVAYKCGMCEWKTNEQPKLSVPYYQNFLSHIIRKHLRSQ